LYKALLERIYGEIPTKYFETYISLSVSGTARVWVTKRKNDRAFVEVKHGEETFQEAVDYLNKDGISFGTRAGKYITFNVSAQQLMERSAIHEWLVMRLSQESLKKQASQASEVTACKSSQLLSATLGLSKKGDNA